MFRHELVLQLLLLASPAVAAESSAFSDPVAVVRAFYDRDSIRAYEFYSSRLKRLFIEDVRRSGGDMGNLTFAFHVNAQDTETGWEQTLKVELVKREKSRAEVRATFQNFRPQDIRYTLVREKGKWLIDDARSVLANQWVLSKILSGGQ
jgi:hypothetical protein